MCHMCHHGWWSKLGETCLWFISSNYSYTTCSHALFLLHFVSSGRRRRRNDARPSQSHCQTPMFLAVVRAWLGLVYLKYIIRVLSQYKDCLISIGIAIVKMMGNSVMKILKWDPVIRDTIVWAGPLFWYVLLTKSSYWWVSAMRCFSFAPTHW